MSDEPNVGDEANEADEAQRQEPGTPGEPRREYPVAVQVCRAVEHDPRYSPLSVDADVKPSRREWFQFALSDIFRLSLLTAILLGILGCLPHKIAAAAAGLLTLVSFLLISAAKPKRGIIYVYWLVFVGVYVGLSIFAVLRAP